MSRRTKFILALIIAVAVSTLFVVGLRRKGGIQAVRPPTSDLRPPTSDLRPPTSDLRPPSLTEVERAKLAVQLPLETLARSFAERYGSYSNQNQFENIKDLYPFMTDEFRGRAAQLTEVPASSPELVVSYSGVTTTAASVEIVERAEPRARVRVFTRRKETKGDGTPAKIYEQPLELILMKDDAQWKVDQAEWK